MCVCHGPIQFSHQGVDDRWIFSGSMSAPFVENREERAVECGSDLFGVGEHVVEWAVSYHSVIHLCGRQKRPPS